MPVTVLPQKEFWSYNRANKTKTETLTDLVAEQLTKVNKKETVSTMQFPHVISRGRFTKCTPMNKKLFSGRKIVRFPLAGKYWEIQGNTGSYRELQNPIPE